MLSLIIPTMGQPRMQECLATWHDKSVGLLQTLVVDNSVYNRGVLGSMRYGYEQSDTPYLAFIHDDVLMHEQAWDLRVLAEFDDPSVGVVGFGGALQLGHDDLYRTPYRLTNLARQGYCSNTDDAERHGTRETGSCGVATLDGFVLIARRSLIDTMGGFPVETWPPMHHYDHYLCLMARRHGYRVRMCGVRCVHLGGMTTVGMPEYKEYMRTTRYGTDVAAHVDGHVQLYETFRDVLPARVTR